MSQYSELQERADRLRMTFYMTRDEAVVDVDAFSQEVSNDCFVRDVSFKEIFPNGSTQKRYLPCFEFGKTEREIELTKNPNLFGKTFPPFRKSDMNLLRLVSIGNGCLEVGRNSTKSYGSLDDFLRSLYDESPLSIMTFDEYRQECARNYFIEKTDEQRQFFYTHFLHSDAEDKRICRCAESYFADAVCTLDKAANENKVDWLFDELLDYLPDHWKKEWLENAVLIQRSNEVIQFGELTQREQVEKLLKNWMDLPKVREYVNSRLIEEFEEDYLFITVNMNLDSESMIVDISEDIDCEAFEGCDAVLIVNKSDFAQRYFKDEEWSTEKHKRSTIDYMYSRLKDFQNFLFGNVWEGKVWRNGKCVWYEGYYGNQDEAIAKFRDDLKREPNLRDFIKSDVLENIKVVE